jgi:hypothetical protein
MTQHPKIKIKQLKKYVEKNTGKNKPALHSGTTYSLSTEYERFLGKHYTAEDGGVSSKHLSAPSKKILAELHQAVQGASRPIEEARREEGGWVFIFIFLGLLDPINVYLPFQI